MTTQRWVLEAAKRVKADGFDGLYTSRLAPLAVVRRLVAKGLMAAAGEGVVCDGDDFVRQPERWRKLWAITPAGERFLEDA